ncbi:MAG: GH3 auxin-responsive promoter family protein [Spirochaetota bacterium]|nr:MAG: GH3 auxin-responsive promoter family protein [Spirochaetota bacterium]
MENLDDLLKQNKKDEIWKKYCGFLDLTLPEFMSIQENLLMEQLDLLKGCEIGKKILGPKPPKSLEEFRQKVPYTTYYDYSEYLLKKTENVLPQKPYTWAHTSGRSGEYELKWIPYSKKMYELTGEKACSGLILASCRKKGDIALKQGDKVIFTLASPPYVSGIWMQSALEEFKMTTFPPFDEAVNMDFQQRIKEGFKSALVHDLDLLFGITSIILKIGEQFSQRDRSKKDEEQSKTLKKPKVIAKLLKALLKAKLHRRNILPKDIWKIKGILCGGADTSIYKDRVKKVWGCAPLEAYGSTEFGLSAFQAWNYEGLYFLPDTCFWEFLPEEEYRKMTQDTKYKPRILLFNEVEPNRDYVLVGTNFHGGTLIRYIIGDMIRITALEDKVSDIKLPQMVFLSRVDDLIDIGGFTRLTEKIIWQAIENSGLDYIEWITRKEYQNEKPVLHCYIELKEKSESVSSIEEKVHESLKQIDEPYRELEGIAGVKPIKITLLSKGTFQRYFEERQAAGADLAHLKPPHINPSESVLKNLLRMSSWQL